MADELASPLSKPLVPDTDCDLEGAPGLGGDVQETTNFKSRTRYRWVVLVLVSVVMFGSYYCYDNPAALNTYFTEDSNSTASDMPKLSNTQFNALYTAYSAPNTVLPFFGGFLVDKLGCRIMLMMFTVFLVVGQVIFAFGASLNSFYVMIIGRIVYGFGGESLCVAAQTLLADWFLGKEMAMAMGINLSVSRVGSVINDQTSVIFYKAVGLPGTLWLGVIIVGAALVGALGVCLIDKKVESDNEGKLAQDQKSQSRVSYNDAINRSFAATRSFAHEGSFLGSFIGSGSFTGNSKRNSHCSGNNNDARQGPSPSQYEKAPNETEESEEVHLSDIKHFGYSFWLICLGCVVVYGCVLPFNNIASGFISHKYYPGLIDVPKSENDYQEKAVSYSNTWMMIPFIISAVLSPFLGGIVDRVGQRANLMLASAAALTCVHLFFALAESAPCPGHKQSGICFAESAEMSIDVPWYAHPVIGLVLQGVAYSVYAAAIWPAVVYVVKPNQVGTAYGLVTAVQNSGLALVPLAVGALTKDTPSSDPSQDAGGFQGAEFFFVGCAILGCIISVMLMCTHDGKRINLQDPYSLAS